MKEFKDMQFHISRDTDRGLCHCACGRQDRQLNTYDWLYDVPGNEEDTDLVEVQFKNTRKGYYHNVNHLDLQKGDTVAVEANPGHDIGVVTLTGRLVKLQVKKANLKSPDEIKRVYRIAKPTDMDKYYEAKSREHGTMIQSRQIAKDLGLQMKIGDVEYQGDGNKAIFYYIADERVDFRQLIKVLADTFHVRIEMKQIGARQEAGRIGGTGPCGRELCCATWMKNFVSVSTNAARIQDISLNPQKLAGMCAKLKCCLNYEVDDYVEAGRKMPARDVVLQTADSDWYLFKTDILAGLVTYSTDKSIAANLITISAERARAVIEMNRRGEKPEALDEGDAVNTSDRPADLLADADISRFDKAKKKKKAKNRPNRQQQPANNQQREPKQPKQREQRQPKPAPADMQQQPRPQAQQYHKPQGQQPKPQGQQPKPQGQHPQQPRSQGQQQKQQANQQGQQQPKPQHPAKPQAQQPKQQPQANADVQK
ncbi:PSP1 domain-containing protein [Prevotella sp.]